MRPQVFIYALVAVLFVRVPAHAQGIVYEVFGTYVDALRQQAGIPGLAATIVDRDGGAWEGAYGRQDLGQSIATRTDTPFNADGLTQVFTATMILQCVEERRLSLDDRIGSFKGVDSSEPDATIRQLLTHTSADGATFVLRPEKLAPLWPIVRACAVDSYRETFANLLIRLGMFNSVPGANIVNVARGDEGVPHPDDAARYASVLQRRATPYAVDDRGRASAGSYPASSAVLTPASGLVTTVRDLAEFDRVLKDKTGILLQADTLNAAWSAPVDASGRALPHGLGWFVQDYNGEKVVWQFGVSDNASSSLMIMLPARGLTFIVMANSDRLVRPFPLEDGDVSLSPFAKLFLNVFVR